MYEFLLFLTSYLLSSYSRWRMHIIYKRRYNYMRSCRSHVCCRAKSIRIMSYQFRVAPYSLSASVCRRVLQKCRYIGHLCRANEVEETNVPNPEHERRTPEEDKWLKEIVYQNGFDFYVLLHHRCETLAADPSILYPSVRKTTFVYWLIAISPSPNLCVSLR